jgi:hypothetical protein
MRVPTVQQCYLGVPLLPGLHWAQAWNLDETWWHPCWAEVRARMCMQKLTRNRRETQPYNASSKSASAGYICQDVPGCNSVKVAAPLQQRSAACLKTRPAAMLFQAWKSGSSLDERGAMLVPARVVTHSVVSVKVQRCMQAKLAVDHD